jgi:hypothetical protein
VIDAARRIRWSRLSRRAPSTVNAALARRTRTTGTPSACCGAWLRRVLDVFVWPGAPHSPSLARLLGRYRAVRGRHGRSGVRPSTHAPRRARLARDVLHEGDGALTYERAGHRMGRTASHPTQRAAWEASDARAQMLNHRSESKDRPLACLAQSPKCRSIGRGTAEPLGSGDRCTPLPSYSSRQVPRIRHTFLRWRDRRRPSCNRPLAEPRSRACPGCARVTTLRT